jgi:hypothetical protein
LKYEEGHVRLPPFKQNMQQTVGRVRGRSFADSLSFGEMDRRSLLYVDSMQIVTVLPYVDVSVWQESSTSWEDDTSAWRHFTMVEVRSSQCFNVLLFFTTTCLLAMQLVANLWIWVRRELITLNSSLCVFSLGEHGTFYEVRLPSLQVRASRDVIWTVICD